MIVITASKQPIFENPRPEFEPAEVYLPALKRRVEELLAADPELPMSSSYVFIRTEPRNSP